LGAKLLELQRREQQEKLAAERGEQAAIAWGSQIRSYVLHPYRMVKDLRTGVETSDSEGVLDGEIDEFIEAFLRQEAAGRSA
jgi:peptide chain release factor 2